VTYFIIKNNKISFLANKIVQIPLGSIQNVIAFYLEFYVHYNNKKIEKKII
jgi:hypothetical protein